MGKWKKQEKDLKPGSKEMRAWLKTKKGLEYKKRHSEYMKQWRKDNREKFKATQQECYQKARLEVLTHYSGGIPKCACCGEANIVFLSVDHIDGNGAEHRREIKKTANIGGNGFVYWLKKHKFPEGFQILCYNCNFAKRQNAECPHKTGVAAIH